MSCYRVFACNLPAIRIPDRPSTLILCTLILCTLILCTLILSTLLLCILFAIRSSRGTSLTPCPCRPVTCSFNPSKLCYSRHPNPQASVYLVLGIIWSIFSLDKSNGFWIFICCKRKTCCQGNARRFQHSPLTGDHAETQGMSFGTYMNRRKEKLQSPVHLLPVCHVSGGLC